jgi:hypothetical protein
MNGTTTTSTGRSSPEPGTGEVRRLVGLERNYRCSVGHEHRSWSRLRTCPDCGEPLTMAVISRAALAPAA